MFELAAVELLANRRKELRWMSMNALPAVELLANNTELVSVKIVEYPQWNG